MQITVQLPDDLIEHAEPGREVLEALAIEGYRTEVLSHYQASQLLGLSRFEFDGFLKQRHVYDHAYDLEDLARGGPWDLTPTPDSGTSPGMIVVADTAPPQ
jgi:predicted HTH domain antitoxin